MDGWAKMKLRNFMHYESPVRWYKIKIAREPEKREFLFFIAFIHWRWAFVISL